MWSRRLNALPSRRAFHALTFAFAFCSALVGFSLLTRSGDHFIAIPAWTKPGSGNQDACDSNCDKGLPFLQTSHAPEPIPYDPYPEYNSEVWKRRWRGAFQPCAGPDGSPLDSKNVNAAMKGFSWNSFDSPLPTFGSYEAWKLDNKFCTDRQSRYGAYGYQSSTADQNESSPLESRSWEGVNWGHLQQECLQRNADRYESSALQDKIAFLHKDFDFDDEKIKIDVEQPEQPPSASKRAVTPVYHPRTAVIIRGWIGMDFSEDGIHNIRSMIMELSLFSGAEYEVIILVDAKDTELPAPSDTEAMDAFKKEHLPEEFRDIAIFFNLKTLEDWYPKIEDHGAMAEYLQPVQIFSRLHPQYDHIWQFEMDSRYTGHWYHLLQQASTFAKEQPRKNLWERNTYFYMPTIHGPWDDFVEYVDATMAKKDGILGPRPANGTAFELFKDETPMPPTNEEETWTWGVGEDADIITWLPSFDPVHTGWPFKDRTSNFPEQEESMTRRVSIVAMSRLSSRLLHRMHVDKVNSGLGMHSEMSPLTWAMFYGLKAVQVPQPIYHAHEWDPVALNKRANPGKPGLINGGENSIWNPNPETAEIVLNITYMFATKFPERLYRAWLGFDEGEEIEPMCLPPMLLHPVKNTNK